MTWLDEQFKREAAIRAALPMWLVAAIAGTEGVALFRSLAPSSGASPEREPE